MMINDSEPTDEERAEAEQLRLYLDGHGAPPTSTIGGTVGLLREAAAGAPSAPGRWRDVQVRVQRGRRRRVLALAPAWLAAAALIAFFVWPRTPPLPPGPGAAELGRAVSAVAGSAPISERLQALHSVASSARARLVAEIVQTEGAQGLAIREMTQLPLALVQP